MAKRQRHVYPTSEIPHLWAHQTQADARNPTRNLFFEGDTIYSYGRHFPIARHVSRGKRRAVLLTTRTYSSTTAKHIWAVRRAIPSTVRVFRVHNPLMLDAENTVAQYVRHVDALLVSAAKRRDERYRARDLSGAQARRAEARIFCRFYGIVYPKFPRIPAPDAAKLERQLAQRAVKWAARNAEREREKARWALNNAVRIAENVAQFRAGAPFRSFFFPAGGAMLRVEGEEVVTSMGARVPLDAAVQLAGYVAQVRASGVALDLVETVPIGHYALSRIEADGAVVIGCHRIAWAEIERFMDTCLLHQRETLAQSA